MPKNKIAKLRQVAFERQNGHCWYCGCQMIVDLRAAKTARGLQCTAEHLVPKSEGGPDNEANIVAACGSCNWTRHRMKPVLEPDEYKHHVMGRIQKGKWHCHLPAGRGWISGGRSTATHSRAATGADCAAPPARY